MGIEPEELEEIQEQYPIISFIYTLQTNKQGSFYDKMKWEHLSGVVLRFEDGVVNIEKNGFGSIKFILCRYRKIYRYNSLPQH